ncbi:MAG: 1-acyl-sn-glycerol-3-phosphate acyltransferase [Bacteroidaceae bacterium]|nr:1-acyl-sn-glycerol-3-phosphate acyltransferase [Bacteroidaceae bacterium]MBQ4003575.1 1-acyl-sn-glycerol-3-phosphate acyltransferase [Bacteroidaceae bacterium]
MMQSFWRRVLCKWMGFTIDVTEPLPDKYIIALAPHTSNWDFFIGQVYSLATGRRCNFMMKKQWFFWPLGIIMRRLGGIPIDRTRRSGITDQLAQQAIERSEFRLCITPEGTRKANSEWKKGFYFIALKANLPILLFGLDYAERRIVCHKTLRPTGDVEADMKEIKAYFLPFKGKHPELFAV